MHHAKVSVTYHLSSCQILYSSNLYPYDTIYFAYKFVHTPKIYTPCQLFYRSHKSKDDYIFCMNTETKLISIKQLF